MKLEDVKEAIDRALEDGFIMKKYEQRMVVKDHQINRLKRFIKETENIDDIFARFIEKEYRYSERMYSKGIETSSTLFNIITEYVHEFGKELDINDDYPAMFLNCAYEIHGFVFKLYVGQGSLWEIEKDGKIIF